MPAIEEFRALFVRYTNTDNDVVTVVNDGIGLGSLLERLLLPDIRFKYISIQPTLSDGSRDLRTTNGESKWAWMGYPCDDDPIDGISEDLASLVPFLIDLGWNGNYELRLPHVLAWSITSGIIGKEDFVVIRYKW